VDVVNNVQPTELVDAPTNVSSLPELTPNVFVLTGDLPLELEVSAARRGVEIY